jgi:hypothetical protein
MRNLTAAGLALALAACTASAPAFAYEYRAVAPTNCWPSLDQFVAHELNGKPIQMLRNGGAWMDLIVTWNSGTVEHIAVGPTPEGFCIVAREFVTSPEVQAAE